MLMCLVKRNSGRGIVHRLLDEHGDDAYSKEFESDKISSPYEGPKRRDIKEEKVGRWKLSTGNVLEATR